jgi:signal transduction histidine kinase
MNKLWVRLSLGFGGVLLATTLLISLVFIIAGGIRNHVVGGGGPPWHKNNYGDVINSVAGDLATYYQAEQTWTGSTQFLVQAQTTAANSLGRNQTLFLMDSQGYVVDHVLPIPVNALQDEIRNEYVVPVQVDGQTVGYVGVVDFWADFEGPPNGARALAAILGFTVVFVGGGGIVFGVLMSRSLTAPLDNLVEGAKALGTRDLSRRVEEKGSDEMIAVARAFNEMASELEEGEQLRRNLLADVAHELRTPLTVLRGNLRAILDDVFPCDNNEIARLYEHTRFLSRMVNDLHELAQAEAKQLPLDFQEIDLGKLVTDTADTFRPGAEAKEVDLQTSLAGDLPLVEIDAARLRQVLQNLLANALRHTPEGGTITVGAETDTEIVKLTVADTGEGIPPDHLPHIFDRFYRTDPARTRDKGGSGLGLAITRAIVEAHSGRISAASTGVPGEGTTFTIELPAQQNSSS